MALAEGDADRLLSLAFALHSNPGAYALLLGAGVSMPSGLPSAWQVLTSLTTQAAELVGESPDDPAAWFERTYGEEANYETVLSRLAPTKTERQRLLRGYFEPAPDEAEQSPKPTTAHESIARLVGLGVVRVIVTLNFDRLMEQALRAQGIEPVVLASPADVRGASPLHTLDCCVVHLHGDYLAPESMLNTHDELHRYRPPVRAMLNRILDDYGLVIAGWSAVHDSALRNAVTARYPSRFTLTWIESGTPQPVAEALRLLKRGDLVPTDADLAFGFLADAVASMRSRETRHPLTVPVAVETAKRELSGGRVAIGLHDTLNQAFARLHDLPEIHLTNGEVQVPDGGSEVLFSRIREASQVPVALTATLAYWGSDSTDQWWLDEIPRFSAPLPGSGLTSILEAPQHVGAALLWGAGVAAVAGGRWRTLRRLLKLRTVNIYSGADSCAAGVLGEKSGAALYRQVAPVLRTILATGQDRLDDVWQTFEVLRLAWVALDSNEVEALCAEVAAIRDPLTGAEPTADLPAGRGGSDANAPNEKSSWQARQEAIGEVARRIDVGRAHILGSNTWTQFDSGTPIAERLARDLQREGPAHVFVTDGLVDQPWLLRVAIEAVGVAAGRAARSLAWSRVQNRVGAIPNQVWLDTGRAPDEPAAPATSA